MFSALSFDPLSAFPHNPPFPNNSQALQFLSLCLQFTYYLFSSLFLSLGVFGFQILPFKRDRHLALQKGSKFGINSRWVSLKDLSINSRSENPRLVTADVTPLTKDCRKGYNVGRTTTNRVGVIIPDFSDDQFQANVAVTATSFSKNDALHLA